MTDLPTRPRPVSRVVVVDDLDRVLLFDSQIAYGRYWLPPGGGLEPGETYEEAAARELWEETGLRDVAISACIWTVRFSFLYERTRYDQAERYYFARVPRQEIDVTNWQVSEALEIQEHRWWTVSEIAASTDPFRPVNLAELLPPVLAGILPVPPLEASAGVIPV